MQRRITNKPNRSKKGPKEALYPPSLAIPIHVGKTYRFLASAAITARNLTIVEILDLLCMAATTTSAYRIMAAVKLKKIEIWAASPSLDVPVTVSFQLSSATLGLQGNSLLRSDTSMGYDRPAHIKVKFSELQQVGQWQDASSTGVYGNISVPKGAIVDFTYSGSIQEVSATNAVAGAVAGATVGQVYLRALDNSQATPQLLPVSYVSI